MQLQLVIEGGARRVGVIASESAQYSAHRHILGDLRPRKRVQESDLAMQMCTLYK